MSREPATPDLARLDDAERVSLFEVLDRVLNKGAVVFGEVTVSVADVDLLYLGLQLVLTSIETARQSGLTIDLGKENASAARCHGSTRG